MKYCYDGSHQFCEIYYWVNKKANSWFPTWGTESYSIEEVAEVINNYQLGVEKKEIPEWVMPRNSQIEYKIIQYLIKHNRKIQQNIEARIRAIFLELVNSVHQPVASGRSLVNPCILYPITEKCDGSTEKSKVYLDQQIAKDGGKPSALFEWNNLLQTIVILSATSLVVYGGVKYIGASVYKRKRLSK